jgi:hypothetical protein
MNTVFNILPAFDSRDQYAILFLKGFSERIVELPCIPTLRDGKYHLVRLSDTLYDKIGFIACENPVLTDEELYEYFDSINVPRTTDGDFSQSPIQATSEGMVTFGTAVTKGYLDVASSDFVSLCGRKPLSIKYIFEHVEDYLLGDRHPTEE